MPPDTPFLRYPFPAQLAEMEAWVSGEETESCGQSLGAVTDERLNPSSEALGNVSVAPHDRRSLLRRAYVKLHQANDQSRWDLGARVTASEAAELLRQAGRPDLAADCEDEFGCDVAALLAEIERECGG